MRTDGAVALGDPPSTAGSSPWWGGWSPAGSRGQLRRTRDDPEAGHETPAHPDDIAGLLDTFEGYTAFDYAPEDPGDFFDEQGPPKFKAEPGRLGRAVEEPSADVPKSGSPNGQAHQEAVKERLVKLAEYAPCSRPSHR